RGGSFARGQPRERARRTRCVELLPAARRPARMAACLDRRTTCAARKTGNCSHMISIRPINRWRQFGFASGILLAALGAAVCSAANFGDWRDTISKERGTFPMLRPAKLHYEFGWSGFTAAEADASF